MKLTGLNYESPQTFTFKQRVLLFLLPPLIAFAFRFLYRLCRVEVRHEEHHRRLREEGRYGIIAIWHESMALGSCLHRNKNYHSLTSFSFDGELAARVVTCFGLEAVRGSSSRGGSQGLAELEKALGIVTCGFTLDGPRGPRRVAKPGAAILAARTGAPVLPMAFQPGPCWRMRSWDRFPIPKPFARAICVYGPLIEAPPNDSPEEVEKKRLEIEQALNQIHAELDEELGEAPGADSSPS